MTTRSQNECQFPHWEVLPDGGRRYWYDRRGSAQGWARYIKIVDVDENTLLFVQEVYDDDDNLIARHQKYPEDTGHQVIEDDDQ